MASYVLSKLCSLNETNCPVTIRTAPSLWKLSMKDFYLYTQPIVDNSNFVSVLRDTLISLILTKGIFFFDMFVKSWYIFENTLCNNTVTHDNWFQHILLSSKHSIGNLWKLYVIIYKLFNFKDHGFLYVPSFYFRSYIDFVAGKMLCVLSFIRRYSSKFNIPKCLYTTYSKILSIPIYGRFWIWSNCLVSLHNKQH